MEKSNKFVFEWANPYNDMCHQELGISFKKMKKIMRIKETSWVCENWIFDRHRHLVYFRNNKKKSDKITDLVVWSSLGQFTCKSFLFQRLTQNIKWNLSLMQGGDCCCSFGLTSKIIIFCLLGTNLC